MPGLELVGIALVAIAIVMAFRKKNDRLALSLIIVLLVLLYLLGYFNTPIQP